MRVIVAVMLALFVPVSLGSNVHAALTSSTTPPTTTAPSTPSDSSKQADASIAAREVTMAPVGDADSFSLTVTNETTGRLDVSVAPTGDVGDDCELSYSPRQLEALDKPTAIGVFVPEPCKLEDNKLAATLTVGSTTFEIIATSKDAAKPDWELLLVFRNVLFWSAIGAVVGGAVLIWLTHKPNEPMFALPNLDAKWDFKDAWASNVTVLGGVLTGVIGSTSVVKSVIGEDADSALAVSLVAVAIAAGFAAAGAVVVSSLKWDGSPTKIGILAGGALVATGAIGEVWVIADTAKGLSQVTDRADDFINTGMVGTYIILGIYLVNTTWTAFREGTKPELTWETAELALVPAVLRASTQNGQLATADDVREAAAIVRGARPDDGKWPDANPAVAGAILAGLRAANGNPVLITPENVRAAIEQARLGELTPDEAAKEKPGDAKPGRRTAAETLFAPRATIGI